MRTFSFSFLVFLSLLVVSNNAQNKPCKYGVLTRKSWRDISPDERKTYIKTLVAKVYKLKVDGSNTRADQYTKIHYNNAGHIHGYPMFFPWHRQYLVNLEQDVQAAINGPFVIPYWNWVKNQRLGSTDVWGDDYFGRSAGSVNTGNFNGVSMSFPSTHAIQRNLWNAGSTAGASQEQVNSFITGINSYDQFRMSVEGSPHGSVHVTVNGDLGQMYSPNDPLFYSHHATVDKIWWNWQNRGNNANLYGGTQYDPKTGQYRAATIDDVLVPFTSKVRDVFSTAKLCYTYAEQTFVEPRALDGEGDDDLSDVFKVKPVPALRTTGAAPGAAAPGGPPGASNYASKVPTTTIYAVDDASLAKLDAFELLRLDVPTKVTDVWIELNNLDPEAIRESETVTEELVSKINSVAGYISPSALWYSDNAIKNLLRDGKRVFKATVNQGVVVVTAPKTFEGTDSNVEDIKQAVLKALGVKGLEGGRRKHKGKIDEVVTNCGERYHRAYSNGRGYAKGQGKGEGKGNGKGNGKGYDKGK